MEEGSKRHEAKKKKVCGQINKRRQSVSPRVPQSHNTVDVTGAGTQGREKSECVHGCAVASAGKRG